MSIDQFSLQTSLRDLAFVLFKRKWSLLIVFLVTVIGAAGYVFLLRDDIYQVSAKILVRIGHEQEPSSTVMNQRPMTIVGQRYQDVNSEADILSSADLLARLVDELRLDVRHPPDPPPPGLIPRVRYEAKKHVRALKQWTNEILITVGFRTRLTPREEAIAMLQKGLIVTPQKDSNVVVVNLLLPGRQGASGILNKLLEMYQEFRLGLFSDNTARDFFEAEVGRSRDSLAAAERELHEFEKSFGIVAIAAQEETLLRQLSDAQEKLTGAEVAAQVASMKVARLDQELKAKEPDFAALGAFDQTSFPESMMLQLADLQKQREFLMMTPVAESASIENNRKQFSLLVGMIASNLRSALAEKDKAAREHKAAVAAIQSKLDGLQAQRMRWNELQRNAKMLEGSFLFYQNKLEQTSATRAMEMQRIGNVEVIQRAIDPFAPAGIRKMTLLGMSVGVALLAALAYVAALEFFDHRVYTAAPVEQRLRAPVMAVVPLMKGRGRRRWIGGNPGLAHRV